MGFLNYKDLDVFNECKELVKNVYSISKNFPNEEIYCLTNQIRRASISIISNIAEGTGRNYTKDSLQFFYISRGSLFEVEAQLLIAKDLNYISEEQLENILLQCTTCKKLLNGFINYHKSKL
ncbi:MAG: four helix bundle protein [Bacteroidetes bacterium RIFCSPLOWO2_12_FULL_31_6]|nr:MAG: four helix bundle protein [Bacteroidetes bacterium RIFCSPLOWO2_12_FULL_31_6]